jgi:hypothetical protein
MSAATARTKSDSGCVARFPDGKFENLKVIGAGEVGTFEWDLVTPTLTVRRCDLLRFVGDNVATKNAFRKVRG